MREWKREPQWKRTRGGNWMLRGERTDGCQFFVVVSDEAKKPLKRQLFDTFLDDECICEPTEFRPQCPIHEPRETAA